MSAADEGRSIGTLVAEATSQVSELMHDEMALLKAKLSQDIQRGIKNSAVLIVAAFFALLALLPLTMALGFWLRNWLDVPLAIAFLLVGGFYLLFTVVLVLFAVISMKRAPSHDHTASIKQSVSVLSTVKPHTRNQLADAPHPEGDRLQA
jgi:TRAP-type C4-dicarboxylate transport system permease small subunit